MFRFGPLTIAFIAASAQFLGTSVSVIGRPFVRAYAESYAENVNLNRLRNGLFRHRFTPFDPPVILQVLSEKALAISVNLVHSLGLHRSAASLLALSCNSWVSKPKTENHD